MKIRPFESHDDRAQCVALQHLTWGRDFTEKVPAAMLLVTQKLGGVCAGAFDDDGQMRGFVFGVTGLRDGKLVHWSDMLAVHPDAQGQRLGERLKEFQRDHCRRIGVATIYWTYDPLVARNAHLNLNRMRGRVDEFVPAMYGEGTNSPLQGDMPTDRFVVSWAVDPMQAATPLDAMPTDAVLTVGVNAEELPLEAAANIAVRVPRDITALANSDIAAARQWRFATRRAFAHYLSRGYHVRGFVTDALGGSYLLVRR